MAELKWQREPPDSPGIWLWLKFEDGMVLNSGTCAVLAGGGRATSSTTVWAKIDLPSQEFLEGDRADD